jgi:osmoprotectant transport system substrate-binding protein
MKRFISLFARCTLMALLVMTVTTQSAFACVGKSLIIGALDNTQQQVLAQMLSILISERTGTSVKVVLIDGHEEAHEALLRADLDMYVEYTGIGQVVLLQDEPIADSKALFEAVKGRYKSELNLIWMQPFGFSEDQIAPAGTVADAAPVVRKDTLKKFPALARLINKLGGVIDAESMETLEKACNEASSREVARNFLKQNRFI